jgi:sarcosine oxidase gamma subunit
MARDGDDAASLLHFAPGRVLAPDPSAATEALLDVAAAEGLGTRIDVTGKWERYSVRGSGAARLLACALSLDAVLDQRDCAAVTIFDCPAIIAKRRDGFDLWVLSSYAGDFLATAENFRAALQRQDYTR